MVEMIDIVTKILDTLRPRIHDSDNYEIEGIVWMQGFGWNDAFHDACTMITRRIS